VTSTFPVPVPLSADQRDKLLKQRDHYKTTADNLDDQLMKLKVYFVSFSLKSECLKEIEWVKVVPYVSMEHN
jgi:hypothetical protein